jgi:DNA-binding CsgD family transcriptional regulator
MSRSILEVFATPAFVVGRRSQVIDRNHAAAQFLQDGSFLRCSSGQLLAANQSQNIRLRSQIERATTPQMSPEGARTCTCKLSNEADTRQAVVLILPMGEAHFGEDGGLAVLVATEYQDRAVQISAGILSELFGLTEAEERIASMVACGHTPRQICEGLGVSMPTVRTHLSRIYQKTDTGNQASLARLLSFVSIFRSALATGGGALKS